MALSRIDTTNMIEDVPQSKLDNNINFRNIIINGDMSIAQRGTSSSNVSTGYHTCDRWNVIRGAGQLTVSQETDAPTGSGFVKSFKFLEASTGANPGASDRNYFQQRIEGQNLQYLKKGTSSAQQLTLSFWIKATVTGTYIAELFDTDNSRQVSKAYTVNSSNTWEYKTITFPADTTGAFTNDNGVSLDLSLYLTAGSNFTSGTLNTTWNSNTNANRAVGQVNALASGNDLVQFTGVQLEAGDTASDFEFLPHDTNALRCNRYFQRYTSSFWILIQRVSDTTRNANFILNPEMRATPTFTGTSSSEIGNTSVQDSSSKLVSFQHSSSADARPRYTDFNFSAEL
jgi:hypothetical protein